MKRTFEKFVDRGGEAAWVAQQLLEFTHQMFSWWHRVRDGTLQPSSFQTYVSDLRSRLDFKLWYGHEFADEKTARTCANLRAIEPALWTYMRKEGVEPTNNAAERALRHAVLLWRKGSFGTHSPDGSRFVERMLTVRATPCANRSATSSTTSPRPVRQLCTAGPRLRCCRSLCLHADNSITDSRSHHTARITLGT